MKVLVTGSLGLVGSESFSFFKEKDCIVSGIDNNLRSELFSTEKVKPDSPWGFYNFDIRDEKKIDSFFSLHKRFDVIIHTAAQPSHDWAKREPLTDFDINARATLILLEAARKYCPKAIFIYVSTDKVYGENMYFPHNSEKDLPKRVGDKFQNQFKGFTENLGLDFAGRRSLFGCSKTAADIYVQEYGSYFGMTTVCFRPGCITGKNHKGAEEHGFLAYLAKCIKEGKSYTIFGDGKQVRDQIHVHDLVTAFWHFVQEPEELQEVYNIGGGLERSVSVLEAIDLIERETGKKAIVEYGERRRGDREWDVHDVSKFRADYPNWEYSYSLQDIIKDVCNTK